MNKRNPVSRFLSMLLVLVMVFGMVPFQAFAADGGDALGCQAQKITHCHTNGFGANIKS